MRVLRGRIFWLLGVAFLAAMLLTAACEEEEEVGEGTPAATPEATEAAEEVPGVTDTEILLGTHFALSGHPAAAYAPIVDGEKAYFEYINAQGGIHGRKIRLLVGDSQYSGPVAAEVVRKLVEQDGVFAIIGGLGTPAHSAVWKYLEENGVPDFFILSGATKWTEPVVKTRFGGNPDYVTEGRILGQYIAENYDGKKLGIIAQNDDFGRDGTEGLRAGIEGSDVEVVSVETYEEAQSDMTAPVQRLRNAGAEVIAAYTLPPQGAHVVKVARETLSWDVPIVVTGVDAGDIFIALAGPQNAEGVISVVFGRQIYHTDDPGIQQHIEIMEQYGGGVAPSNFTIVGQTVAELTAEVLDRAGPNLTREAFVEAAESLCGFTCSFCLVPASLSPTDHRPFEIEVYVRVEEGKWVEFGEPVSFESTPECPAE